MNLLPLILLFMYLRKTDITALRNILPKLDIPSFMPLFKLLGLNEKTTSLLTSEKFSEALNKFSESNFSDFKSLIPVFAEVMTSEGRSGEQKEQSSEEKTPESANVNAEYFTPVKEIIPEDVSEMFSEFFR